jgi:hypothetical protein
VTDRAEDGPRSGWDWVEETAWEVGGTLMFARGSSPRQVMEAFGMVPAEARLLSESDVQAALRYEVFDDAYQVIHPWIRVGTTGEWAFAIDESAAGYGGYEEQAARELSAGTDVAWLSHTQNIDYFHYFVRGTEVTAFEPLRAWDRFGSDPDRFLAQMRQVGLDVDPTSDFEVERPARIALLDMLTLALGIHLPAEVALGPLLTVQRGPTTKGNGHSDREVTDGP